MTATVTEPRIVEYTDSVTPTSFESSIIAGAWYNSNTKELFIQLRTMNGYVGYAAVQDYDWQEFIESESMGRYYNKDIKNRHRGTDGNVVLVKAKEKTTYEETMAEYRQVMQNYKDSIPGHNTFTVVVEVSATSLEEVEEMFGEGIHLKEVTKHY